MKRIKDSELITLALLATLIVVGLVFGTGCTTLVKDCEQQGGSQYYHCQRVWMPK